MLFASIEKCPVFAGKVRTRGRSRRARAPRRARRRRHRGHGESDAPDVRCCGDRRYHLGRHAGQTQAEDRVGRRSSGHRKLDVIALAGRRAPATAKAPCSPMWATSMPRSRGAARVIEAEYEVPFLAHACMEPVNCTAEFRDGKVEIWGPMQMPMTAREIVARKLAIPPASVTIHLTRMGGGFGRRLLCDYVVEAAWLAQKIGPPGTGRREPRRRSSATITTGRTAFTACAPGLDAGGRIVAWDHHAAGASRNAYRRDPRPAYSTEIYGMFTAAESGAEEASGSVCYKPRRSRTAARGSRNSRPPCPPAPGARPRTTPWGS